VRVDGSDGTSVTSALDSSGDRMAESASGGGFGWSLSDLHGDIIGSFTSSGAAIGDAFRYDPYGLAYGTGSASAWDAWRYQGRQVMSTGSNPDLYLMGARWYVPSLGVFSQFDTVTGSALDPLSLNRYLYTEADPTNLADPTGHCATRCIDYGESNAAANPGLDWAAIYRRWAAEARARKAAIAFRERTARHIVETEAPVADMSDVIARATAITADAAESRSLAANAARGFRFPGANQLGNVLAFGAGSSVGSSRRPRRPAPARSTPPASASPCSPSVVR
jgi:RHS repeat-associated protein